MTKQSINNLVDSDDKPNTRCFFDIDFDGHSAGRIIFELFNNLCPRTCENFRALCTGMTSKKKTFNFTKASFLFKLKIFKTKR